MFSKNIGEIVKKNKNEMIDHLYKDKLKNIFEKLSLNKVLKKSLNDEDFFHIKDSMYSLDFWIYDRLLDEFADLELKKGYSDTNIL
jgi:hypothetical protein